MMLQHAPDKMRLFGSLVRKKTKLVLRYMVDERFEGGDGKESAEEMIGQLAVGQETVVRTAREAFPAADAANDEPTADPLTQRMQIHEKNAWMLRSMLA